MCLCIYIYIYIYIRTQHILLTHHSPMPRPTLPPHMPHPSPALHACGVGGWGGALGSWGTRRILCKYGPFVLLPRRNSDTHGGEKTDATDVQSWLKWNDNETERQRDRRTWDSGERQRDKRTRSRQIRVKATVREYISSATLELITGG